MSKEKIELFKDIDEEFSNIKIQMEDLKGAIEYSTSRANRQTDIEKWIFETVCPSSIEEIYSGIERVLIRIGIEIGGAIRTDDELINEAMLNSMAEEIPGGVRPAVISHETLKMLNELRLFSVQARDTYGYMVGSLNLEENAEKVIAIVPVVINEINSFKTEIARIYSDD